jgi:uncharacterized protein YbjT (DUF2867 family)
MNNSEKTILVIGATGQQGGAVTRHLLAKGWSLRALTRDPSKPAAQALTTRGVEVVQGDMEDRESLERAMRGVYGVFSVQTPWSADPISGAASEERQGKRVADAAKAVGIQHLVYSSVGGAERKTGVPHFESKFQIEERIRALGIPHTILRPVAFMENFNWSREQIQNGVLPGFGLPADKALQLISSDDIGALAAIAFDQPQGFLGKAIEIAGDELTELQQAELFARAIGRPVTVGSFSLRGAAQMDEEMDPMVRFFKGEGYQADIAAVRTLYPQLTTLETWIAKNGFSKVAP